MTFHSVLSALVSSFDSPPLLLLAHPFALEHLTAALTHVTQFRVYLGSLSASSENSQIARDVLTDLVDSSGVDIVALGRFLVECMQDCRLLDSMHFRSTGSTWLTLMFTQSRTATGV